MAFNKAIPVLLSDTINIPQPGAIKADLAPLPQLLSLLLVQNSKEFLMLIKVVLAIKLPLEMLFT